ncbi:hypothetical protein [Algibacter sp. R77976]|uniref:hypothetical protein n=1 Tax=Algibacter sp. R77976 TaxID=3093873 RepID=UPI0037C78232
MKKENLLLVLWIIFGFTFIQAVDSILNLIIILIHIFQVHFGFKPLFINIFTPIISFFLYIGTSIFLLKKLKYNSISQGIYLTRFPKNKFIILLLIAIISTWIMKFGTDICWPYLIDKDYEIKVYYETCPWRNLSLIISKFITIILLFVIFFRKLKSLEQIKN